VPYSQEFPISLRLIRYSGPRGQELKQIENLVSLGDLGEDFQEELLRMLFPDEQS